MDHLRALRVINYVYGTLLALGAIGMALTLAFGAGHWMGITPAEIRAANTMFVSLIVGVAVAAALMFLAGVLVAKARGRILQTVLATLNLFEFPVGTIYGLYALWVCWFNDRTREAFRTHTPLPPPVPG